MTVQLSSLRVSMDLNSSGYVQGAQAKVNADQAMAQSSRTVGAALAQQDAAAGNSGGILGRLQRQYVDGYGSATRFENAVRLLQKGVESGNVPLDRAGLILQGLHAKYGLMADASAIAAKGNTDLAAVVERTNAQLQTLTPNLNAGAKAHSGLSAEAQAAGHSMRSFVDSVISGQSPTTAFAQQIGNLQFAASGRNGLSGALKEVGGTLSGLITPARAAGVALAAAAVVAYNAWSHYDDVQKKVLGTLQGVGQGIGVTVQQFNAMAEAAAKAGHLSVDVARGGLNDLARTNQLLNPQEMVQLVSLTKNWAATYTDGSLEKALSEITDLVKGGPEAIRDWLKQQNLLNPKLSEALDHAVRMKDANEAIRGLVEGTAGHLAKWDETTGRLDKAWDRIKTSISDLRDILGPLIDKAAGFVAGSLEGTVDRIKRAASGDLTAHPLVEATVANAKAAPLATVGEAGVPSAVIESWQQLTTTKKQAAQVADQVAAAEAKVRPQLTETGTAVAKLDDDLRSAQSQLRDQLNESFNPSDRSAITEKLVKVRDALDGTSDAAKKAAVAFAQSDNAQIASGISAEQAAAKQDAATRAADKASQSVDEQTKKIVSESEAYKDAKATLDLFADARRQNVKLTDDQIEAEDRARHVVESQKNAEGERMTQAEQAAKVRENEIATIKARTLAQEQSAKEDEVENRNRGRSIEGLQNEAEKRHASTVILTQWQEQQERTNRGIQDNIAVIELQKNGLFANDQERAAAIARMQAELEMVERLGPGWRAYAQAVQYVDLKAAAAKSTAELQKQDQIWGSLQSTASSALSSLAKDLASSVKPAEALTKALGGIGDSLTKIGTDSLSKSLTNGLKGLLGGGGGGGFSFDPVSLGLGAAGIGLSFVSSLFSGDAAKRAQQRQKNIDAWQKAQEDDLAAIQKQQQAVIDAGIKSAEASARAAEEATAKAEAASRRIESFSDRATLAGFDTNTLGGQLAALDLQQQREREQEVRDGGEALVALEQAQYAEREKLLRDYTTQALTEEKRRYDEAKAFLDNFSKTITSFVNGLTTGSGSPLSPADRLAAAQSQFDSQLALAQGGNRDALNGITGYASTLLDAGKAFYGSSTGYQSIFGTVTGQLTALPSQISPEQLIVNAIDSQTLSLSDILTQLDINGDGMISRQEAANTWLASLFTEIDTNGDGQITKLELIRFATSGTQTSVDSTNASVAASNALLITEQSILNTMSGVLSAVSNNTQATYQGIQNDLTQAQTLGTYTQKIVFNTASIASHDGAPAQFSEGGLVDGPGTGTSDSIAARLSAGEYVMRAATVQRYGASFFDRLNRGDFSLPGVPVPVSNDNGAATEIRSLRAELADLKRALSSALDTVARATEAGAEHVREGVDQVADSHTKLVAETKLQNARRAA